MELKARHVVDVYDNYSEHPCEESSQVYLKSEVDKVIAEKNTKIIQLEALIENYNRISREIIDNANHQKYKRCLAMAKSCKNCAEMFGCMASHERLKFGKTPYYQKCSLHANIQICHEKKWLELAEQFKEAK